MVFELSVIVLTEKPLEDGLLDFLVVLFLKKLIVEKLHRCHDEELTTSLARIEGTNGPVSWETDRTRGHDGHSWSVNIQSRSIGINEFQSAVFIALNQVIIVACVTLGIFTRFLTSLLSLSFGNSNKLLVENTIANEAFLWM